MALLPVYDWLGLDDDLTRRQRWGVSTLGFTATLLVAHAVGVIDLGTVSADVLRALPGGQATVVGVLAIGAAGLVLLTISEHDLSSTPWIVAGAVGGFFLIDLFYLHPSALHFDNAPSLFYWLAKPIWTGVPMFVAAWWLINRTDVSRRLAYTIAAVIGVVVLQLYYTVIPIPVVGGESIQIGLVGNLTVGVPVHGAALLAALTGIVLAVRGRRYVGGVE